MAKVKAHVHELVQSQQVHRLVVGGGGGDGWDGADMSAEFGGLERIGDVWRRKGWGWCAGAYVIATSLDMAAFIWR
jgi:hypothetical protein